MMCRLGVAAAVVAICGFPHWASSEAVHVVRLLEGYQCMALTSSYGPQGHLAPPVPVYSGPEKDAHQVGMGAGVIVVPTPLRPQNGRTSMVAINGTVVWIDLSLITPWHSLNDPKATCKPAVMSNGRVGFTTSN